MSHVNKPLMRGVRSVFELTPGASRTEYRAAIVKRSADTISRAWSDVGDHMWGALDELELRKAAPAERE